MNARSSLLLAAYLLSVALISCDNNALYEESFPVSDRGWESDDSKTFSFHVEDTLRPVNLYTTIRTSTDYPYANLYLFLYSNYPNGYTDKDTLELILAEPSGKWLGSNSGTVVEHHILIAQGGRFTKEGTYTFKMEHAMREEVLPEILDVGFKVEWMVSK